jgi:hypothetical protein
VELELVLMAGAQRLRGNHRWTYATGRQEAVREAQMMIDSSKAALENFKAETDTARNQMTREREPTSREVVTKETY